MKRQYFNLIFLSMLFISCVDRFRIPNDINQKGIYSNYRFEPSSLNKYKNSSVVTTDFFENVKLHILKYRSDYRFEKAN